MENKNLPIGIFDSGIGGLTVLKELKKQLPNEKFIYLADMKNNPYGEKSGKLIESLTRKIIEQLIIKGVKMIIIACNTASSYNIDQIRRDYKVPILTVLESGAKSISTNSKKILIAATTATCEAGLYSQIILKNRKGIDVDCMPCPLIVPAIETNNIKDDEIQYIVDGYLSKYKNKEIDTLILGCTHYPILIDYFKNSLEKNINIIDPAIKLSLDVREYLENHSLLSENQSLGDEFLVTDNPKKFKINALRILNKKDIKKINSIEV